LNTPNDQERSSSKVRDSSQSFPKIAPLTERRDLPPKACERVLTVPINHAHRGADILTSTEISHGGVTPLLHRVVVIEVRMGVDS
jgi:hypothetical protein